MISDAIQLPDAPGIHGLRFRHFRAGDDFNHMANIARVSAEAFRGEILRRGTTTSGVMLQPGAYEST